MHSRVVKPVGTEQVQELLPRTELEKSFPFPVFLFIYCRSVTEHTLKCSLKGGCAWHPSLSLDVGSRRAVMWWAF